MPLPEALGIISFSLGIITFAQNGIRTIRTERDRWQRDASYIGLVEKRLESLGRATGEWRKRWIVPDFAADEQVDYSCVFAHIWGDDWVKITSSLQGIVGDIATLTPILTKFIRSGPRRVLRIGQKLNLATGGRDIIDGRLEALKSSLDELKCSSDTLFRDKWAGNNDQIRDDLSTIDDSYIRKRLSELVLLKLADTAGSVSQNLYSSCTTEQGVLSTILMIDLFPTIAIQGQQQLVRSRKRQENIFKALALGGRISFTFNFLIKSRDHPTLYMKTNIQGLHNEIENSRNSLSLAFNEVWRGGPNKKSCFLWGGTWFSVNKDSRNNIAGSVVDDSISVHETLTDNPPRLPAMNTKRAQLAYLLAEFGLLFLKTQWMQGICRCRLRRMIVSHMPEYMIRPVYPVAEDMTRANGDAVAHNPSENAPQEDQLAGGVDDWRCWCQSPRQSRRPFGERHLPYLGLLLAEIAICRPIHVEAIIGMVGAHPRLKIGGRERSNITIVEMVSHAAGSPNYSDAVQYCLNSEMRPEDVGDAQLKEYYDEVFLR